MKKKARGEVWVYRCRTLQKPLCQIECPNSGHTWQHSMKGDSDSGAFLDEIFSL